MPSKSKKSNKRVQKKKGTKTKRGSFGSSAFIIGVINFVLFILGTTILFILPEEETIYDLIPFVIFCLFIVGIVASVILTIVSFMKKEPSRVLAIIAAVVSLVLGILLFLLFVLGLIAYILGIA